MSKLLYEQSNLIIIGSWNPAIIQHQWLKSEFPDLIDPDPLGAYLLQGNIQALLLEYIDFKVQVNQQNLIFTFKNIDDKTLDRVSNLAKGVYDKLKHTPISLAGCNFVYELELGDFFSAGEGHEESERVEAELEDYQLLSREVRYGFSGLDHKINIHFKCVGALRSLQLNYDYSEPSEKVVGLVTKHLKERLAHSRDMVKKFIRTQND
jgi:hypothetical protein